MLENSSQLLLRNITALSATKPLFVNIPPDDFIVHYQQHYPLAEMSTLHFHRGDYDYFSQKNNTATTCHFTANYAGEQSEPMHDLVIMQFPKSKQELAFTLAMISGAVKEDASCYFVGEKNSGIKSVEKLANNTVHSINKIDNARHCILYFSQLAHVSTPFILEDWFKTYQLTVDNTQLSIAALPGVFSQLKLDAGTAVLLPKLPKTIKGDFLDFGCGAGVIAAFVLKNNPEAKAKLIDVNILAIESSKRTFELNHLTGEFIASNGLPKTLNPLSTIISNPPFHQRLKTNYQATETFIKQLSHYLRPDGCVYIVANSFLQYQPIMESSIGSVTKIQQQNGFTVYLCSKNSHPKRN